MRRFTIFSGCALARLRSAPALLTLAFTVGCAARVNKTVGTTGTLAELHNVRPDVQDVKVEQGLEQAMQNYRRFLDETPETTMTPEAMRRLADLQLEKQFGIRTGDTKLRAMAAPQPAQALAGAPAGRPNPAVAVAGAGLRESDQDFERRTTADSAIQTACQQACPAKAIVFGDMRNDASQLARQRQDRRFYHLLADLGTLPPVGYLAKIRNRNESRS